MVDSTFANTSKPNIKSYFDQAQVHGRIIKKAKGPKKVAAPGEACGVDTSDARYVDS